MRSLIILCFLALPALCQPLAQQIVYTTTTPSGSCANTSIRLLTPNGTLYTCQNGTWSAATGVTTGCSVAAGILTCNGFVAGSGPAVSGNGVIGLGETTGQTCAAASVDCLIADSASHRLKLSNNNGTAAPISTDSSTDTLTNKSFDTAGTGNSFKINGTSINDVSGSGAVCLASGSACGSAPVDSNGYQLPWGEPSGVVSSATVSANQILCWQLPALQTQTLSYILSSQYGSWNTGWHAAFAIYSIAGNLIQQSGTYTGSGTGNNPASFAFATPPTLTGGTSYYACYTDDNSGAVLFAYYTQNGPPLNQNGKHRTVVATNVSTGTSTLTFPATLGALSDNISQKPYIALSY